MSHGLLAEFETEDECARAAVALKGKGLKGLDAYMPYPSKSIEQALGLPPSTLPRWVLLFGLLGAGIAYLILWWTQNVDYPLNVGGHPTNAVPAYVPITFETAVLFAGFASFLVMLWLCRLPRLWHAAFDVPGFARASVDRFFLLIELGDDESSTDALRGELERAGALRAVPIHVGEGGP